jgi:diaminopropionate ammonia-lyase
VAWPVLSKGVDLFVEIEDRWAREAMRMMAGAGIVSGETGAAGLAGLLALAREGDRGELGLTEEERVLVFNCEGATDPGAYGRIVAGADGPPPSAPS